MKCIVRTYGQPQLSLPVHPADPWMPNTEGSVGSMRQIQGKIFTNSRTYPLCETALATTPSSWYNSQETHYKFEALADGAWLSIVSVAHGCKEIASVVQRRVGMRRKSAEPLACPRDVRRVVTFAPSLFPSPQEQKNPPVCAGPLNFVRPVLHDENRGRRKINSWGRGAGEVKGGRGNMSGAGEPASIRGELEGIRSGEGGGEGRRGEPKNLATFGGRPCSLNAP